MEEVTKITEDERRKRIKGAFAVIALFGGLAGFMITIVHLFASGKI